MQQNQTPSPRLAFVQLLEDHRPQATAWVQGSSAYPQISGLVKFYDTPYGGFLWKLRSSGCRKKITCGVIR